MKTKKRIALLMTLVMIASVCPVMQKTVIRADEPSIVRVYADKEHKGGAGSAESSASLFDGNYNTKYFADADGGSYTAPFTIEWDYNSAKRITSYTFVTGNDMEGRDPVAWTLYASTQASGDNYTKIDTKQDNSDKERKQETTYSVRNGGDYLRYRLVITATRSGYPLQISEIIVNSDGEVQPQPEAETYEQPALKTRYTTPANGDEWYDEMVPIGNGMLGASIYGGVENDSILMNEKTIWSGGSQEHSDNYPNYEYNGGFSNPSQSLSAYSNQAQSSWKQARQTLQQAVNSHSTNGHENYNIPSSVNNTINQMKGDKSNFGTYQELGKVEMIEPDFVEPSITRIYADKEHKGGAGSGESSSSIFDGNTNSKYFADSAGSAYTAPYTIEWDYSFEKEIYSYTITTGNDVEGRDPVAWTLYASTSSSGNNYVQIDQREDTNAKDRQQSTTYTVANPGRYVRYRWVVTRTRENNPLQLSEFAVNKQQATMNYSNYERGLDLDNAVASVSYTANNVNYTREYFASNPDNVMAVKLSAQNGSISKFFRIASAQSNKTINAEVASDGSGIITMQGQPVASGGFKMKTGFDKALYFAQKVKIIPNGGTITKSDNGILVNNASSIVVIVGAGTNYKLSNSESFTDFFTGVDPMIAVSSRVEAAAAKGYDTLKQNHIQDYKALYDRVKFGLKDVTTPNKTTDALFAGYERGNSQAENRYLELLYYQFGRYLLIASSRENDSLPANLQGIWAAGLNPPWSSDYHTNINLQMNYWLSESTNLSETHEPVFKYIDSLVKKGTKGVDIVFGTNEAGRKIRGWTIWHENNPWGNVAPAVSDAFYSPEDAAWLCEDIWEHYQFTKDEAFLRANYDTLKNAALFWVDSLWTDTRDNTLVVNPSYSPEHGPYSLGATEAQSVVWEIFDEVIKASQIVGDNSSEITEIRNSQSRLSGPKIGSAGQFQEWKDDTNLDISGDGGHRHTNHLYGLHPGSQIVAGRSAQEDQFVNAMKVTLNTRGDGGTGWSKAWKINFWARVLDGEHAQTMVKEILTQSTLTNLLDVHPPFQIDGNFGATSGMTEMLLQSQGGIIKLIPAISTKWSEGSIKGLKARGNVEVDMNWTDNEIANATLKAGSTGTITVSTEGLDNKVVTKNNRIIETAPVKEDTVSFEANAGDVFVICDASSIPTEEPTQEPTTQEPTTQEPATEKENYDFVITDLIWSPSSINVGDNVVFKATVKNIGNADAPAGAKLGVRFDVNGDSSVTWSDTHYSGLRAGESVVLTANGGSNNINYWTAKAGEYSVSAYVNDIATDYPDELDRTNNTLTKNLTINSSQTYAVTLDGNKVATVEKGETYTLPMSSKIGYYGDGKLYKPGSTYTVNSDVSFSSVKFAAAKTPGLRYTKPAGLSYQGKISCGDTGVFDNAITETGVLAVTNDRLGNGAELVLDSNVGYIKFKVTSWLNNVAGSFATSFEGIKENNYERDFVLRGYIIVNYADGTKATVYTTMTTPTSVSELAYKTYRNKTVYNALSAEYKALILEFIGE